MRKFKKSKSENPSDFRLSEKDEPELLKKLKASKPGEFKFKHIDQLIYLNNYGASVLISAGTNTNKDAEKQGKITVHDRKRHEELKNRLNEAGFSFSEYTRFSYTDVLGNYGVDELSCIVLISKDASTLIDLLKSESLKTLGKIAGEFEQDSILPVFQGECCYLYTSGKNAGKLNVGDECHYYEDSEKKLPSTCYSKVELTSGANVIFQHQISFEITFDNLEEYIAYTQEERSEAYAPFFQAGDNLKSSSKGAHDQMIKKQFVVFRGLGGYNHQAVKLKKHLVKECGVAESDCQLVSSDAHIAQVQKEVDHDKQHNGEKSKWEWPQIRDEFINNRNPNAITSLINQEVPIIGYCDMNKDPAFFEDYVKQAKDAGYEVLICHVDGETCQHPYMQRHAQQFKYANDETIKFGSSSLVIPQLVSPTIEQLTDKLIPKKHLQSANDNSTSTGKYSVGELTKLTMNTKEKTATDEVTNSTQKPLAKEEAKQVNPASSSAGMSH